MTLDKLAEQIRAFSRLDVADAWLGSNQTEINTIFIGMKREERTKRRFDFDDCFDAVAASNVGREIASDSAYDAPFVTRLLLHFASFFLRMELNSSFAKCVRHLPTGGVRQALDVAALYKWNLADVSRDFAPIWLRLVDTLNNLIDNTLNGEKLAKGLLQDFLADVVLRAREAGAAPQWLPSRQDAPPSFPYSLQSVFTELPPNVHDTGWSALREQGRSDLIEGLWSLTANPEDVVETELPALPLNTGELPAWLDHLIANAGGIYDQRPDAVRQGVAWNETALKCYLGTYFPRTVIEYRTLLGELSQLRQVHAAWKACGTIRVLDFGSGLGAAWIGAVLALRAAGIQQRVEVVAIDGNSDALALQQRILSNLGGHLGEISAREQYARRLPTDLDGFEAECREVLNQTGGSFDLILASKTLSEYYLATPFQAQGIIRTWLDLVARRLKPEGLCVISDITLPFHERRLWVPKVLAQEVNQHVDGQGLALVVPASCAQWANTGCGCFTQRHITVRHSLQPNGEISKITARVLAHPEYANTLVKNYKSQTTYRINASKPYEACRQGRIIHHVSEAPSGFDIPQLVH